LDRSPTRWIPRLLWGSFQIDVDAYSAAKAALGYLLGSPDKYNSAVAMWFDDVSFFFANEWAGELPWRSPAWPPTQGRKLVSGDVRLSRSGS
jgi:hypothetical protein